MLATSRDRTKGLFLEDVVNFLINSDISVNTNVKDTGQSGNNINFEILIGRTKTTSAKALKLVNNPTGNAYKEPIFSITDVRHLMMKLSSTCSQTIWNVIFRQAFSRQQRVTISRCCHGLKKPVRLVS